MWVYGKNKEWESRFQTYSKGRIPVISGITSNNGVNYYTEDAYNDEEIFCDSLTISTRGEYSGTVTYHQGKFLLANNILVMLMPNLSKKQKIFIGTLIEKLNYGGYNNYPKISTLAEDAICLPIKNDQIDFDFMEDFISELEAYHISELEAYLQATGLSDYELTPEEKEAIDNMGSICWKVFSVTDIFRIKNTKSILSSRVIFNSGKTPYLCASSENNGVASYISYNERLMDEGQCVFIGGKTFVVSYQKENFYSNDSHNLALYLHKENGYYASNHLIQLFLATSIFKALRHKYSWGNSISKAKIQSDIFTLPIKPNTEEIDFTYMQTLISAVQKLVIKDVVLYANKKIEITKQVSGQEMVR